jgi:polyhydroxybutyrate depolymerase
VPAGETPESATLVTYSGCKDGTEVALWRFTGSGHVWPGATFNTGPKSTWVLDGVGRGITLVDANELMWQFFQRYSLPATP